MNPLLRSIADQISTSPFENSGDIYHPLPFPEFSNIKVASNPIATYRKWSMIQRSLPIEFNKVKLSVLDIGANAGFYTFSFAQKGAAVDAYEPHEYYVNVGRKIVEATGLEVCWHQKPVEESDLRNKSYDIALLLSVFQWISHGNAKLEEATDLLSKILSSSQILYFELGCNKGKSSIKTGEPSIIWIWKLLNDNGDKSVHYLGSTSPWRGGRRYMFACSNGKLNLNSWQKFVTKSLSIVSP